MSPLSVSAPKVLNSDFDSVDSAHLQQNNDSRAQVAQFHTPPIGSHFLDAHVPTKALNRYPYPRLAPTRDPFPSAAPAPECYWFGKFACHSDLECPNMPRHPVHYQRIAYHQYLWPDRKM
jgi:hypothetical protein